MARYGRGQICLSMTGQRLDELEIPLAVAANTTPFGTAFCVPIDAKRKCRRPASLQPIVRATVLAAIDPTTTACDLARPGHVLPLRARGRRRAGARRADRGGCRSGADGWSLSGRRHLRNHERGRHDGPGAGADEVRQEARPADDHHRRPDPVPDAHRAAGEALGARRAADRTRRLPDLRLRQSARSAKRTSRSCAARSATARTCWSACTRSA